MQRVMIVVVSAAFVCVGCSSDNSKDNEKTAENQTEKKVAGGKDANKPKDNKSKDDKKQADGAKKPAGNNKVAAVTGCQKDLDCKGIRVCENGKCVMLKKPTMPKTTPPATGTQPCKGFATAICESCGKSSSLCTMLQPLLTSTGAVAIAASVVCERIAPQLGRLKALSADKRNLACSMMETAFSRFTKPKKPTK